MNALVLTRVMFSIKTPLLTHCDNSSSFVRSLGIKLYKSALPFSPDYSGSQHLLLLVMVVPGLPKPLPTCQPSLTFRVVQVIWQARKEVGRGGWELVFLFFFFSNNWKLLTSVRLMLGPMTTKVSDAVPAHLS